MKMKKKVKKQQSQKFLRNKSNLSKLKNKMLKNRKLFQINLLLNL